uniref:Probable arginine--tRNA ligase, mitochondrial n=1 Tax=Lygus hesperus TaxID=30085 RepID=A0A0K8TDT7_LYGHE
MGHLRSTIVGQFAANMLSRCNNVTRINYLGDWGTQFGFVQKGLEMIQPTEQEMQEDPMSVLLAAYTKSYNTPEMIGQARDLFAKLENEDSNCIHEWGKIKTVTLKHLCKIYEDLGIRYNEYCCESDYRASKIQKVIETLIEKQVAYYQNDQLVTNVCGNIVPLLRQNKTTLYITRDVAAALDRMHRFKCDNIFYVADKSQIQHFKNLAGILDKLGHQGVLEFLPFGRITGMSTRKGTSVLLSDIVEESVSKMAEQQKLSKNTRATDYETTRVLGLTGLQVYILKHGRMRDFVFDWSHALQGTGDSGVKVQYTHSRLFNLEERFNFDPFSENINPSSCTASVDDPSVLPLVLEIVRCDEVFRQSTDKMESSLVVNHLFKLCNLTSRTLKNLQVKDQDPTVSQHRLLLFHKARLKIKQCMELLGLMPLNKM